MPGRVLAGLILLLLGAGFLVDQLYGMTIVGDWWPLLLVLAGVNWLARHPYRPWWPLCVIAFGLLLQINKLQLLPGNFWSVVWAVLLVMLGIRLLLPTQRRRRDEGGAMTMRSATHGENTLNEAVTFSGAKLRSDARQFAGGHVSAAFGAVELDLRGANLSPDGAVLELTVVMGAIEVHVPMGWPILVSGSPLFGACEISTQNAEMDVQGQPVLRIQCGGILGAVQIKN